MTHRRLALAAIGLLIVAAATARGDDASDRGGRFSMSPVEGGQMRLDKETGAVALCARRNEAWACEAVEDKAKAIDDKLKRLEDENKELKNHIANLEAMLDKDSKGGESKNGESKGGDSSSADKGPPGGSFQVPSEEEVDKALDYVERVFKKFRDRIQRLEKPAPGTAPAPDGGGRL